MQGLICHVQKSFTTLEEAAAKNQMPIGSVEELTLKPSHVHGLSNITSAASPEEAGKLEAFPLCKKGMFPKAGARGRVSGKSTKQRKAERSSRKKGRNRSRRNKEQDHEARQEIFFILITSCPLLWASVYSPK